VVVLESLDAWQICHHFAKSSFSPSNSRYSTPKISNMDDHGGEYCDLFVEEKQAFIAKNGNKTRQALENRTAVEKKTKQGGKEGPPWAMMGTIVIPWWLLLSSISCFLNVAFWVSAWMAIFALDLPYLVNWASFARFLESIWRKLHSSLLTLCSLS